MRNNLSKYAETPDKYADDTVLQSTLRELQDVAGNPRVWIAIFAVIMVLTVAGPFGTNEFLGHAERFVYWSVEAILTFFCGLVSATAAFIGLEKFIKKRWLVKLLSGLAPAIPVSLIVWTSNVFVFGPELANLKTYVFMLGNCLVISVAITVIYYQIREIHNSEQPAPAPESDKPRFLKRLPVELGTNLLHASSQDHYVHAVTDRGSHMVLMRFTDAVEELSAMEGLRIHRAHWVAKSAVRKPVRNDGRLYVETVDGEQFPVSRTYLKEARKFLGL